MIRNASKFGVILDVDGVLIRGSRVIPQAIPALRKLVTSKIPTLFVTNGGNMTESLKAQKLSEQLGFNIEENQIILSHTPWRNLAASYRDKQILVIGSPASMAVATAYGFRKVVSPECLHQKNSEIYPVKPIVAARESMHCTARHDEGVQAAFVFSDSADWGLHMQVLTDALLDSRHKFGGNFIPIYACNADIVYTGNYSLPRFTQGAFVHSFQALFKEYTGHDAPIQFCGKPFKMQYDYSEYLFRNNSITSGDELPTKFYAIGDNPKSDIRGANSAGDHWTSILVRTGVFNGHLENDENDPADVVVNTVLDAVNYIFDDNLISQ